MTCFFYAFLLIAGLKEQVENADGLTEKGENMEEEKKDVVVTEAATAETSGSSGAAVEVAKDKVEFTPEQQSKIDELINAQYAKIQAKADQKIKEVEAEFQRKNMTEDEIKAQEIERLRKENEEFHQRELINAYKVELTEKGLPMEFAEHINRSNEETASAAIAFLEGYKSKVEEAYKGKIAELESLVRDLTQKTAPTPPAVNPETKIFDGFGGYISEQLKTI